MIAEEASEFYTELYDIPFAIHIKPNMDSMVAEPREDAVQVYVSDRIPLRSKDVETDEEDTLFSEFLDFLSECVDLYKDTFVTIEEQISKSELKDAVANWANRIGVPMPDFDVRKFKRNLAQFITSDGAGKVEFQPQVLYLPMYLAESLVVHELAHAKRWLFHYTQANGDYREALRTFREEDAHGSLWEDEFEKHLPGGQQLNDDANDYFDSLYE